MHVSIYKTVSVLSCGWLGESLAIDLLDKGFIVKGATTSQDKKERLLEKGIDAYQLRFEDLNDAMKSFLNSDILVLNLTIKDLELYRQFLPVLEQSPVKKLILISSTGVYQNSAKPVDENSELSESVWVSIENLMKDNPNYQTTILRFSGLFGGNRKPGNFLSGRSVQNGEAPVNLIHRDDCIQIINEIIKQDVWEECFNCTADTHPSKKEFYTRAAKLIEVPLPIFDEKEGNPSSFKLITNEKLKRRLNYEFIHADLLDSLSL
ncbi:SDR family NAD(P)-dependent oxidoreductase [Ancylomarina salipaludis]|uniref:SDR family NAD(P)-dependent oxidoreductase n=1 Tax=Ancylomarina salipaludis TaxID=2501299 RepID=A0A4Q1JRS9_9BACT|nr:SDR family NAD(P)-dependent oxidoreductase [Ancylomarina salipaludis]RXQ97495.1 SDR family NAD(P)-dependent oxidoreductase [Ancylomarina salipaludis]